MKPMKRMHCPHCQSNRLSPVVETEIHRNPLKTSSRTDWKCECCGRSFRNLSALEADLSAMEKTSESAIQGVILIFVLCLLSAQMINLNASVLFYLPIATLAVGMILFCKARISKMKAEYTYLKQHCFG